MTFSRQTTGTNKGAGKAPGATSGLDSRRTIQRQQSEATPVASLTLSHLTDRPRGSAAAHSGPHLSTNKKQKAAMTPNARHSVSLLGVLKVGNQPQ